MLAVVSSSFPSPSRSSRSKSKCMPAAALPSGSRPIFARASSSSCSRLRLLSSTLRYIHEILDVKSRSSVATSGATAHSSSCICV